MSRSYRKPYITDHRKGCKKDKQLANRWLRRSGRNKLIGQRNQYKKHFETWDINDYKIRVWRRDDVIKYSRK